MKWYSLRRTVFPLHICRRLQVRWRASPDLTGYETMESRANVTPQALYETEFSACHGSFFFFLSMWCPFLAPYWNFGISKHKYQLTPTYCRYEIWGDLQRSNNFCCVCVEVTETSVLCEDRLVVIHAFPESVEVQWWCLPTVLFWKDLFRDVLF